MKSLITVSSIALLLTACGTPPVKQYVGQSKDFVGPAAATELYQCGDAQVVASVSEQNSLLLEKDKQTFVLQQVVSASGAKYTGDVTEPDLVFWSKGDTAFIEQGGKSVDCRRTANLLPLQIRGNEPGWHIGFDPDVTRINLKYGQTKINLPRATIERDGKQWKYITGDSTNTLTAKLENKLCVDAMSGMTYPMKATVNVGDNSYTGCGGNPAIVLSGGEWKVTHIQGVPVKGDVTLGFDTSGQLHGTSGCNRFATSYTLSGEGIGIGRVAGTRMACSPELMEQEARFLKLLETVFQFEVSKDGNLILRGEQSQVINARR